VDKALLRQEPARTIDALVTRIGHLLDRFLPDECANLFQAAGYSTLNLKMLYEQQHQFCRNPRDRHWQDKWCGT